MNVKQVPLKTRNHDKLFAETCFLQVAMFVHSRGYYGVNSQWQDNESQWLQKDGNSRLQEEK